MQEIPIGSVNEVMFKKLPVFLSDIATPFEVIVNVIESIEYQSVRFVPGVPQFRCEGICEHPLTCGQDILGGTRVRKQTLEMWSHSRGNLNIDETGAYI